MEAHANWISDTEAALANAAKAALEAAKNVAQGQGLTKDEREWLRQCPSSSSTSGSGSATVSTPGGTSVGASGSGSSSQTNPSTRQEITCPFGTVNCTPIHC